MTAGHLIQEETNIMSSFQVANNLELIRYIPYLFSVAIALFFVIGWGSGKYLIKKSDGIVVRDSIAAAIFGLSALVLGFTFSNSANHFNERASNIRSQAASLERLYSSTRFLNAADQAVVRRSLHELLELNLSTFKTAHNIDELENNFRLTTNMLDKISEQIVLAIPRAPAETKELADKLLRPHLDSLVTTFRQAILDAKNHPPSMVIIFLFILLCIGALLSGYAMAIEKQEDWLLTPIYLFLIGYALFVIFSLEFPNELLNFDSVNSDLLRLKKIIG